MQIFFIIGLLIAIFGVVFALQNPGIIEIKFLGWRFEGSLPLVLLFTFFIGFISSLSLSMAKAFRKLMGKKPPEPKSPQNPSL